MPRFSRTSPPKKQLPPRLQQKHGSWSFWLWMESHPPPPTKNTIQRGHGSGKWTSRALQFWKPTNSQGSNVHIHEWPQYSQSKSKHCTFFLRPSSRTKIGATQHLHVWILLLHLVGLNGDAPPMACPRQRTNPCGVRNKSIFPELRGIGLSVALLVSLYCQPEIYLYTLISTWIHGKYSRCTQERITLRTSFVFILRPYTRFCISQMVLFESSVFQRHCP